MTPTIYRDEVAKLAKTDQTKAVNIAEKIKDPWFQAQAWAYVARHADKPLVYARKAAISASKGKDDFQRSAVRAWEVAALAERGFKIQASRSLGDAVSLALKVEQVSSRSEAIFLLFQAAFKISDKDTKLVADMFVNSFSSMHWREVRVRKYIEEMLKGNSQPREFFW